MVIYKIINVINGQLYIGKTKKTTKHRMGIHRQRANAGSPTYLHRAMRKYGFDNFTIEVIDDSPTTENELNECEIKHISAIVGPKYNMTKGGEGGDTSSSPNYKAAIKIRDMSGKNNGMYGLRGKNNPNFGKKHGPNPRIAESKKQPVMADGQLFSSVGECETTLHIKFWHSSRTHPDRFYKL